MLNHAARVYLPAFHDQLRTSVLGRATGRKMRSLQQPGAADEDEAKPSPATHEQIRKFFDAWHNGDDAAQTDALSKIVQTWRGDNAAGGVPVHAHLALPKVLGDVLAQHSQFGENSENRPVLSEVISKLEPGARALVSQQLLSPSSRRMELGEAPANLLKLVDSSRLQGQDLDPQRGSMSELLSTNGSSSRGQQPPNRLKTKIRSSNNQRGRINSQRDFELDQPSRRGGYIIQEVTIVFRPRMRDGSLGPPRVMYHFWEAWEVKAGQNAPSEKLGSANDSVRFERGPGGGGRVEILTRAVFYEGLRSLPPTFKRNPPSGSPGYDPSIDPAGGVQATSRPFALRRGSYEAMTNPENNAIYTDW